MRNTETGNGPRDEAMFGYSVDCRILSITSTTATIPAYNNDYVSTHNMDMIMCLQTIISGCGHTISTLNPDLALVSMNLAP